jgi:beta-galactosidase
LLDYQDNPSDRLLEAGKVADFLNENQELFAEAKVLESGISILYTRESLWIEKKQQTGGKFYEGRNIGGVMKSAIAYFEAFSEMGLQVNFKEISEFNFGREDFTGKTIVLAHQISIPTTYYFGLESFVRKGGKLIIDGLTAYYDEHSICTLRSFPFKNLFGGCIKEFKVVEDLFNLEFIDPEFEVSAHLWRGSILVGSGEAIAIHKEEVTAIKNVYGSGEVFWAPSLIGLGSRMEGNYSKLHKLLYQEAAVSIESALFRFAEPYEGFLMKTIKSRNYYISIIINKSMNQKYIELIAPENLTSQVIYPDTRELGSNTILIDDEETLVIRWKLYSLKSS